MYLSLEALLLPLLSFPLLAGADPTWSQQQPHHHHHRQKGSFRIPMVKRITGDASLEPIYYGHDWIVPLTIGKQTFNLQVDTGSSDLWLLSTFMNTTMRANFPANNFYNPAKSSTYKLVAGYTFSVSYDLGEIYSLGRVGTENITVGNLSVNMPFGMSMDCSTTNMVDITYDGMLGLGFGAANNIKPNPGPTFMEAVQSQLTLPVFTFHLPGISSSSGQFLEFGHVDKTLYDGDLNTIAVFNQSRGWTANLSFSMDGKNISAQSQQVLFDTGGLQTIVHPEVVNAYWAKVPKAKDISSAVDGSGWAFPCNTTSLPDLTYDFVGPDGKTVSATVPGRFFNSTLRSTSDFTMCVGGLQSDQGRKGNVGYAFFHAFFTVFNQAVPSISFAPYPKAELGGADGAPSDAMHSQNATDTASATATAVRTQLSQMATSTGNATGVATGGATSDATASGTAAGPPATQSPSSVAMAGAEGLSRCLVFLTVFCALRSL